MSLSRKFLRELLESPEGQEKIKAIWEEVTTKRSVTIKNSWMHCVKCKEKHDLDWKMFPEYEAYDLRTVIQFLGFAAAYGVGKPPEEKKVDINVTARRLEDATDAELTALYEGRAGELPSGS